MLVSLNAADQLTHPSMINQLPAPDEWRDHEHVSPCVQVHAQKLLAEAGSAGLAKQAIDFAEQEQVSAVGVTSFRSVEHLHFPIPGLRVENSVPVPSEYSSHWWVTALTDGRWIAWNEESGEVSEKLDTRKAAAQFVLNRDSNWHADND